MIASFIATVTIGQLGLEMITLTHLVVSVGAVHPADRLLATGKASSGDVRERGTSALTGK
jgi:hypothetical protein